MKLIGIVFLGIAFLLTTRNSSAQTPQLEWAKGIGGTGSTFGTSIGIDALGNVYTTGQFNSTTDFDPGTGSANHTSVGGSDIFISKLDASGNFVWANRIGSTGTDSGNAIAVDASGNQYITGVFNGTVDFDPGSGTLTLTSGGVGDIFILKLNASGIFQWAQRIGSTGADEGNSITVDPSGDILLTGLFTGTVDFDPSASTTNLVSLGGRDIFVTKFNASGNFIWAKQFGATGSDVGNSVTTDISGNVLTTGTFVGTVDFDPGAGTANLTTAILGTFILKLNGLGNFIVAKSFSGTSGVTGKSISVDGAGNIYTTGDYGGTIDFDPGPGVFNQTEVSSGDIFISKLDPAGNFLWATGLGNNQEDGGRSITVDALGNSYTTGHFAATVDFDPGSGVFNLVSTTASTYDIFILKLDPAGNFSWAVRMGGTDDFEIGESILVDGPGNIYTTGQFSGVADFDPSSGTFNLTGAGTSDNVFVLKLKPPVPTISNFTPTLGPIGTAVTITGTNFSANLANNIIYFGATRATITAATSTQLTVTVPTGATYQPISVLVDGLTAFSSKPFITTFADGGVIDVCSFAAKVDITTGSDPYSVAIGDLDADGKPDLAIANKTSNTISIFKNISTLGSLAPTSFGAKVDFVTDDAPYFVTIQDLDGDGKPELIATISGTDKVSIFKNNTTVGVINSSSFASKVDFSTGQNPWNAAIADLDLDGKPDMAIVNDADNTVSILKNTSTTGVINTSSFATKVDFATGNFPIGIASGDLDGDGKVDLAVTNQTDNTVSVLRNTSTPGNIDATSFDPKIDFPTGLDPYSVAIGDLDGDNNPEIVVANYSSGSVSVLGNASTVGTINFLAKEDFSSGAVSSAVSISDIDGNGKPDLNITSGTEGVSILKNIGTSTPISASSFSPKVNFAAPNPYGLAIADLDGNGKPDVVSTNASGATASILRNTVSSLPSFTGGSFTPTSGPVGTVVTITGTNFSTTPLNNTVKFNGVVATVTASTSTSITVSVPLGATTGAIFLEIGCVQAITISPFTVTATTSPTITSFTPTSGPIGTSVTITGTNFSTTPANNTVQFNGTTAVVTASTSTSITTTVPTGATTGKISVTVAGNTATSTSDFTVTTGATITITTQPLDATICAGATTSFTTAATGTTNITYQWQRYILAGSLLQNINNGGAYSGATTATLTINSSAGSLSGDYYTCVISGDLAASVSTNYVTLTVGPSLSAPLTTGASSCIPAAITLSASGGTNGQYRWYTVASGGTNIIGEVNSTYATPLLGATTTYYVAINDGSCESARTPVAATINSTPTKPSITSSITPSANTVSVCSTNVLTLSAPAGFGTYTWSPSGNTQQITASTSGNYSVVVTNAEGCSSIASDALTVTVIPAPCNNQAPVIASTSAETQIEGKVSLDLVSLISDADGNVDIQSLKIKTQPTSGAKASITASGRLELDYQGISFSGPDVLTIEVCDLLGDCAQQEIKIEVIGDLNIYNGISPNGDGMNDTWIILYIETIEETKNNKVSVYNRWGDLVWETENYDNKDRAFKGLNKNGNEVSSGTYFYRIEFGSGRKTLNGYLAVKK